MHCQSIFSAQEKEIDTGRSNRDTPASIVSSQSRTQIHRNAKLEVAVPIVSEPTVYVATSYAQPISKEGLRLQ